MPNTNHEGLTLTEWIAAARPGGLNADPSPATSAERRAWGAGEDPNDHRAEAEDGRYDRTLESRAARWRAARQGVAA